MAANPSGYFDVEFGNPYDPDLSNPVKQDRFEKWKKGELGYNPGTQQAMAPTDSSNFETIIKQAQTLAGQTVQPQIQALQGKIPNVETEYQNLLKEITQTTRQNAANEFSRRGIPLSSGLVEQSVGRQLAPQIAQAGQVKQASLADIDNAIALLQSGALGTGMDVGMNIWGTQQSQAEAARNRMFQAQQQQQQLAQQQEQFNAQQAWQEAQAAWEQPWQEKLWNYQMTDKPKDTSVSDANTLARNDLVQQAAQGATLTELVQKFAGKLSTDEIVRLYTGATPYGPPVESWAQQILGIYNPPKQSSGYAGSW